MTPLRFFVARTLRNEPMLAPLSVPQPELLAAVTGRHVALVGKNSAGSGFIKVETLHQLF